MIIEHLKFALKDIHLDVKSLQEANIPIDKQLLTEHRNKLIKITNEIGEQFKVQNRLNRETAIKETKKQTKEKDRLSRELKNIDLSTKSTEQEIEVIVNNKIKELSA